MSDKTKDFLLSNAKGAFAAFTGAGLTALMEWASATDFGEYKLVVVAALGVAVNAARKWLAGLMEDVPK